MSNTTRNAFDNPEYLNDIVNQKFGKLTVLSFDHFKEIYKKNRTNPQRRAYYKCQCECGNITYVERGALTKGEVKSCGCSNRRTNQHVGSLKGKLDDPEYLNELVGQKFNMLTVVKFDHMKIGNPPKGRNTPRKIPYYLCKCDCGNTTVVDKSFLVGGRIKSCGCINYLAKPKHGNSKDRIYNEWQDMKQRCLNPNAQRYSEYGGRGITICNEWLGKTPAEGFTAFRDWALANGYDDSLWIDRIDNDGPYAPWNCRWVTPKEQAWNKQQTIRIQYQGQNMNLKDFKEASNSDLEIRTLQRRFTTGKDSEDYKLWSENDKLFIPPEYGREKYRNNHNIQDVFIFDEDSPYNK